MLMSTRNWKSKACLFYLEDPNSEIHAMRQRLQDSADARTDPEDLFLFLTDVLNMGYKMNVSKSDKLVRETIKMYSSNNSRSDKQALQAVARHEFNSFIMSHRNSLPANKSNRLPVPTVCASMLISENDISKMFVDRW